MTIWIDKKDVDKFKNSKYNVKVKINNRYIDIKDLQNV